MSGGAYVMQTAMEPDYDPPSCSMRPDGMAKPPPEPWDLGPPVAKVERLGRWWFRVYVSHGLMQYGPNGYGWHVFGERRAYAKAKSVLRKYVDREQLHADVQTVTLAD